LRVPDPPQRTITVRAAIEVNKDAGPFELAVTNHDGHYTPGYAQFIDGLILEDGEGNRVPITKPAVDVWRPSTALTAGKYALSYCVRVDHSSQPNAWGLKETPHLESTGGVLIGAALFVYPRPRLAGAPVPRTEFECRWDLPTGWQVMTPWPETSDGLQKPGEFDALVDNFIAIGPGDAFDSFETTIGNSKIAGAVRRGGWSFDNRLLWSAFERTIRQSASIFGGLPQVKYLLIINPWPGTKEQPGLSDGGGAGATSFHAMLDQKHDAASLSGRRPLQTLAHETFHWWNPLAMPPAVGEDFYWWHEGITVYFESLVLWRAGIIDQNAFLQAMLEHYDRGERRNPARPGTNLVEASRKISGDSGPDRDIVYALGAVCGFALDLELRRRSNGVASLDSLMRTMYKRYQRTRQGFTLDDLSDEASVLVGADLRPFFARYVEGHEMFDWTELLAAAGYEEQRVGIGRPLLGVTFAPEMEAPTINTVQGGTPANGVLQPGDVVLALGEFTTPALSDVSRALGAHGPGDVVVVRYRRDGVEKDALITLAERYEFQAVATPATAGARVPLPELGRSGAR
jgi:predicted metalloprotease with PDZ domain